MNDTTIIQVPTTKLFRDEMAQIANDMGFSSLQDLIRFNLTQIKNKFLVPTMVSAYPTIKLSPKAAARYDKMAEEIEMGKVKTVTFNNINDISNYLNS